MTMPFTSPWQDILADTPLAEHLPADGKALFPLPHLASLVAGGPDARAFLHGQLTNDVKTLADDAAQLTAWCTAKGRMIANFLLHSLPAQATQVIEGSEAASFRLICSADLLADLCQRLRRYILRAKVELVDESARFIHLGISSGDGALAALGLPLAAPEAPLGVAHGEDCSLIRLPEGRCVLSAPRERMTGILAARRLPLAAPRLWQYLDIAAAFPWITAESTEAFVPQMMDFDRQGGVSFNKGCYPGQEVIARARYLGEVKRHLYRLTAPGPFRAGEDLLTRSGQNAGKVIAAAPQPQQPGKEEEETWLALAVVSAEAANDLQGAVPIAALPLYPQSDDA
ncbi:MAG: hypothetical protein LBB55_03110 [Zoogloeaceae bacterium]|nr:hypothetical protein [Zoogloeaceae bacterium]